MSQRGVSALPCPPTLSARPSCPPRSARARRRLSPQAGPTEATALLVDELRSQTPQGMASASALLTQLVLATLAVHVVLDEPGGTAAAAPAPGDAGARIGRLWGSLD